MGTELAVIEPIKLPNPRRPGTLPSLPAWAARLSSAVRLELQLHPETQKFVDMLILPPELMPSQSQRQAMIDHRESLFSFLSETAANSAEAEARIATAVSKLLVVLAGERKSDLSEQARSEAHLDLLDDVPCWAVEAAVRRWFKHDCGMDERGRPHDYRWPPDPGTLRKIALEDVYAIGARIKALQSVLLAKQYIDCSHQLARGRNALVGLNTVIKSGDLATAATLTFEDAIARGQTAQKAAE